MDSVHDGVDVVAKATKHDAKGRVAEAVYLYRLALAHLCRALDAPPPAALDPQTRTTVQQKIVEYESRCAQLEQLLAQQQQQDAGAQRAAHKDPMSDPHLLAGLEAAERAVQADSAGRATDAVKCYREAARNFIAASNDEAAGLAAETRQALAAKASEYTVRAEALYRRELSIPSPLQGAASSSSSSSSPPPSVAAAAAGGAIPFHLAPGQSHYVDPVPKQSLLSRIGQKFHRSDHRIADSWLR